MGRPNRTAYERRRRRGPPDYLVLAGLAAVLLLALLGLLSAGAWVGQHFFVASKSHPTPGLAATPRPTVSPGSHQARTEATAIVAAARRQSRRIVAQAERRARSEATAIVRSARRAAPAANPQPAAAPRVLAPTSPAPAYVAPPPVVAPTSAPVTAGNAGPPNLSGVPASWKVVAYNVTFGSGPGTAGSITVTNRDARSFSGVARVTYLAGGRTVGSAEAAFGALSPGQTVVLPLNGQPYPAVASDYRISVLNVH